MLAKIIRIQAILKDFRLAGAILGEGKRPAQSLFAFAHAMGNIAVS
jgi:hypothetical protein